MRLTLGLLASSLAAALALAPDPAVGRPGPESRAPGTPPQVADEVDFAREIEPLLAESCYSCHGPKRQRGGLRLDEAGSSVLGGDSGNPAIVPGNPGASELIARVRTDDDFDRMPADEDPLTEDQIRLLERWIEAGARRPVAAAVDDDPEHWAYRPVRKPEVPRVADTSWCKNPVDAFILRRLEAQGLKPAPEADRTTLIRRVSLDLLGLPPTAEEIDAYLADEEPGAYERMVDRLLASPHFGERWARHWLDLARYADSHGYTFDRERDIWPYRDWVVNAFNQDMPFDRFTVEQLAGDLLENPTRQQLVATGFHRNTQINEEGGAKEEEFRVEAVKNRTDTTATVWLGSTFECAKCHSHKYDPITQHDYYRLYAFFDNNADRGTRRAPKLPAEPEITLPTPAEEAELAGIELRMAEIDAALGTPDPELAGEFDAWTESVRHQVERWETLDPYDAQVGAPETTLEKQPDGSLLAVGEPPMRATYLVHARTKEPRIGSVRLEILTDESMPKHGPGRARSGNFVLTEFEVEAAPLTAEGNGDSRAVELVNPTSTYDMRLNNSTYFPIGLAIDGKAQTGWSILPRVSESHSASFDLTEPLVNEHGWLLVFRIHQNFGALHTIGRFRLQVSAIPSEAGGPAAVPPPVKDALLIDAGLRSEEQRYELWRFFTSQDERFEPLRAERLALDLQRPQPVRTMVMGDLVGVQRPTYLMVRGSFLDRGPEVEPGVPAWLPEMESATERPTRLDLARWLVSPENPLTYRVTVNRLWQRLFGLGLVASENDFGTRGERPSHPELLDWLTTRFHELDSRPKALLRLLVTSATYRQASAPREELADLDPGNRLLARQSRLRTEAETIRDSGLRVSGLLDPTLGGPPVYPPAPAGVFAFTQVAKDWPTSEGPDRYRRSLYTWQWRTVPHPFYTTFDAPKANVPCTRRNRSNTPLQALTLANDPMVLEFAGGLAVRALALDADDDERLARAFRWCTAREPEARELALLRDFLGRELAAFEADSEAAALAVPVDLPAGVTPARGAAWAAVARVLLNLDEFVTRL